MVDETTVDKKESEEDAEELCSAEEHHDKFNPTDYLESFYRTASEDTAMQIVLFFLPGILYRLPQKVKSILDLGAGPTVYMPIAFRDRAETIYTSDYAPANRETLTSWIENRNCFDWTNVCKWIASIEASSETATAMQNYTRNKMQAVFEVNVHETPVVKGIHWRKNEEIQIPKQFEVVSTVFCLEYSTETLEGYMRAVKSACSLIEPKGYLVQGGVLDATDYSFGGKRFKCHRLQKRHILEALKANGMSSDDSTPNHFKFITHDEIFLLISKKIGQ